MRSTVLAAVTAVLLAALAAPALAAPDKRGVQAAQLFQEGKYREAAELYVQLRDEQQNPKYLCNLGVCYYKLGHLEPAIDTIKQCLAQANLTAQTRAYYQDLVPKLEAQRQPVAGAPTAPVVDAQLVPAPEVAPAYPPGPVAGPTPPIEGAPSPGPAWPAPPGTPPPPVAAPPVYPDPSAPYGYPAQPYPIDPATGYPPTQEQLAASRPIDTGTTPAPDGKRRVPFGSYVTGAVGVVGMAMGVAFVLHGQALRQELDGSTRRPADAELLESDISRTKSATVASFVTGALGLSAAIVWWAVAPSHVAPGLGANRLQVAVGPGAVGLTGQF